MMTRTLDLDVEIKQLARRFGPNRKAMEEFGRAIDFFGSAMKMLAADRYREAADPLGEAASIARELRVPAFQAKCTEKLAMIWRVRGLHDEAADMARLALGLTADAHVRIEAHNSLSVVYLSTKRPRLARLHAYAAIELLAELPDDAYKAQMFAASVYNAGEAYLREQNTARAEPLIRKARALFAQLRMTEAVAKADAGLAGIAFAAGRLDEAESQLKSALAAFERAGNEIEIAITLHSLARVDGARGNFGAATATGARAAAIFRRIGRNELAMRVMSDVAAMEAAARRK